MSRKRRHYAELPVRFLLLGGAAVILIGCQGVRQAAGLSKDAPDEFAVVTKAPLVIPPDYNLRPPAPGAAPTNQSSPTDSAQAALFGDDSATVAASLPNTYSQEEKALLANSGGAVADHNIRQQIAADSKAMSTANQSFVDQLLFMTGPNPDAGHPVDADAEHDRIVAQQESGATPVQGANKKDSREAASIDKSGETSANKDSSSWYDVGGWFDDIF